MPPEDIHGRDGFRLRFVRTAADTDGDLLEMEATYGGTGAMPPEHLHPAQAERFEVLEGAVRAIVAGQERTYRAGERFEIPAGTPHRMAAVEPSRVRWEVRPALRTQAFFEWLYGGAPGGAEAFAGFAEEIRLT